MHWHYWELHDGDLDVKRAVDETARLFSTSGLLESDLLLGGADPPSPSPARTIGGQVASQFIFIPSYLGTLTMSLSPHHQQHRVLCTSYYDFVYDVISGSNLGNLLIGRRVHAC